MQLWRTSEYRQRRAKYRERPDVRARRINAIEAERRKVTREVALSEAWVALWQQLDDTHKNGRPWDDDLRRARAEYIANRDQRYYAAPHTHSSGYVGPCSYWDALKEPTITPAMVRDTEQLRSQRFPTTSRLWLGRTNDAPTWSASVGLRSCNRCCAFSA